MPLDGHGAIITVWCGSSCRVATRQPPAGCCWLIRLGRRACSRQSRSGNAYDLRTVWGLYVSARRRRGRCHERVMVNRLSVGVPGCSAEQSETGSPEISEDCPFLFRLELPAGEACCSFASRRPRLTEENILAHAAARALLSTTL
jgi:hypothetical protein